MESEKVKKGGKTDEGKSSNNGKKVEREGKEKHNKK